MACQTGDEASVHQSFIQNTLYTIKYLCVKDIIKTMFVALPFTTIIAYELLYWIVDYSKLLNKLNCITHIKLVLTKAELLAFSTNVWSQKPLRWACSNFIVILKVVTHRAADIKWVLVPPCWQQEHMWRWEHYVAKHKGLNSFEPFLTLYSIHRDKCWWSITICVWWHFLNMKNQHNNTHPNSLVNISISNKHHMSLVC